jgi:CDP-diacylglycerol--glycerol-3-phosphate 3-phosphatidyltransferase
MAAAAAGCFLFGRHEAFAVFLCIVASSLDAFDGWYARAYSQCSDLGEFMDPLADKLIVGVMYAEIADEMASSIVWVIVVIILVREFAITVSRSLALWRKGSCFPSDKVGKVKMAAQSGVGWSLLGFVHFLGIDIAFFPYPVIGVLIVIMILTYISAYRYLIPKPLARSIVPKTER